MATYNANVNTVEHTGALFLHGSFQKADPAQQKQQKEFIEQECAPVVLKETELFSCYIYPKSRESTVAELNQSLMLKVPKEKRGQKGILVERAVTNLVRNKLSLAVPDITIYQTPVVMASYAKIKGKTFKDRWFEELEFAQQQGIAQQLSGFFQVMHAMPLNAVQHLEFSPSWHLDVDYLQNQLKNRNNRSIQATLQQVANNHRQIKVPDSNMVLGHFDLHGSNILVDRSTATVSGIIDFGNSRLGDLHQDLSMLNVSSPSLASMVIQDYQQATGRKLNLLLIDHYTTVFYLYLLAALDGCGETTGYDYWLNSFDEWYHFIVDKKATARLAQRQPISALTDDARQWLASQLIQEVPVTTIQNELRKQGFGDVSILAEIKVAQDHPYIAAGRNISKALGES